MPPKLVYKLLLGFVANLDQKYLVKKLEFAQTNHAFFTFLSKFQNE